MAFMFLHLISVGRGGGLKRLQQQTDQTRAGYQHQVTNITHLERTISRKWPWTWVGWVHAEWSPRDCATECNMGGLGNMLNEAQGTVQLNVTWLGWVHAEWSPRDCATECSMGGLGNMLNEAQGTVQLNVTWLGWVTCWMKPKGLYNWMKHLVSRSLGLSIWKLKLPTTTLSDGMDWSERKVLQSSKKSGTVNLFLDHGGSSIHTQDVSSVCLSSSKLQCDKTIWRTSVYTNRPQESLEKWQQHPYPYPLFVVCGVGWIPAASSQVLADHLLPPTAKARNDTVCQDLSRQ